MKNLTMCPLITLMAYVDSFRLDVREDADHRVSSERWNSPKGFEPSSKQTVKSKLQRNDSLIMFLTSLPFVRSSRVL